MRHLLQRSATLSRPSRFLGTAVLWSLCATAAGSGDVDEFERRIRPLLIARCGECHGESNQEGELSLTTPAGILAGGQTGPVLEPGNPAASRLIQAVRYRGELKMPPDGRLDEQEIETLHRLVAEGGKLPDGQTVRTRDKRFSISASDREWWAFRPQTNPPLPEVGSQQRLRTGIDPFLLAKLEDRGLEYSPDVDRRTLIRRLTYDLTGLPPSPEEVRAFLEDDRPGAYERLVDQLLASPQYGIRWGRHWLDIARYADTNGGGFDYVYPHAWKYRDYVVRALNADRPFDEFVTEQIAGDLLTSPCDDETYVDRLLATGFLTLAPKGLGMQDKEQMALDVADDQVDVLGRSLLGLTLSCARCHHHKFDPIATEDYYGLAGIFRSTLSVIDTDKNPSYWPEHSLDSPSLTRWREQHVADTTEVKAAISKLDREQVTLLRTEASERFGDYLQAAARQYLAPHTPPVAHWKFDDGQGDQVTAARGPQAVLVNLDQNNPLRPSWVQGKLGRALRFGGKRDVVTLAASDSTCFNFGRQQNFSVAFWIRCPEGYVPQTADSLLSAVYGPAMWFVALRPGSYNGIYLRHYDGKRAVDIRPEKDRLPTLIDGTWHHLAFTNDRRGEGICYLDGKQVGATSIKSVSSAADFQQLEQLSIGPSTNQFQGELDDLGVWNRQLDSDEVEELFTRGARTENPAGIASAQGSHDGTSPASEAELLEQRLVPQFVQSIASGLKQELSRAQIEALAKGSLPDALPDLKDKSLTEETVQQIAAATPPRSLYPTSVRDELNQLLVRSKALAENVPPPALMGMVARDAAEPRDLHVHLAGNHRTPGAAVPRRFPEILQVGEAPEISSGSGRLELARWLVAPHHPLTTRVFVNRLWQWHFGSGLVRTPNNFGRLGEAPSHPELLDWLACRLRESGWSIKRLHRELVLSSAYRQRAVLSDELPADDPRRLDSDNRLLWRMSRRRLEAEALRDAMLSVSGNLDLELHGTVNTWKAKSFSVDDANQETANYTTLRRSIYLPVVRGAAVHEMLQLFDFGDPNSVTGRRTRTTVASQALFLMNSPFVRQQAQSLSRRLSAENPDSLEARIRRGYALALSRPVTTMELRRAIEFIQTNPETRWPLFCQSLYCLNEFAYVD